MSLQRPLNILTILAQVADPRIERTKRHQLIDILFISLVATMSGCDSWVDVERFGKAKKSWFKRFLLLKRGIPSHDTFSRVFVILKAPVLETCFKEWLRSLHEATGGGQIAIDGKTLTNSLDKSSGQSALHLLCAWSVKARVVLGQEATDAKSNEITAIPALLEQLELKGSLVTIDAMGCQTAIAQKIHQAGGDYVGTQGQSSQAGRGGGRYLPVRHGGNVQSQRRPANDCQGVFRR